jgi:transposase
MKALAVLQQQEDRMPSRRELTMRQMRQVLRLYAEGQSIRTIGRAVGAARSTVQDGLRRAAAAGLSWPLPEELTDTVLAERLFVRASARAGQRHRVEPDWTTLAVELKRPAMSLQILWDEYRAAHPDGYGYSRFCDLFREFERRLSPVMRHSHVAGNKVFVDYSGKRVPIVDPDTGEITEVELFVGVLGASNLTFATLTPTQQLSHWIGAHIRMFAFFGGVPRLVVPDNLKSAVQTASFYDPEINLSYGKMADHYEVGILPARPRRPRDKAKVEGAVRIAQSVILGRLRHLTHFSLAEANATVQQAVELINNKLMRRLGLSRRQLFETTEKAALRALPASPYVYGEWRLARAGFDYHVEAAKFFYSVPHHLHSRQVEVRITEQTIDVFLDRLLVATHQRRWRGSTHCTNPDHLAKNQRFGGPGQAERYRFSARAFGPFAAQLIDSILAARRHEEQGFRTCLGVLRRMRDMPAERVEAAATKALAAGATSYSVIVALLDRQRGKIAVQPDTPLLHGNIRGSDYFH